MAEQNSLPPAPTSMVNAPAPPFAADRHVAPTFDLLELLPTAAADKLRLLRLRSQAGGEQRRASFLEGALTKAGLLSAKR